MPRPEKGTPTGPLGLNLGKFLGKSDGSVSPAGIPDVPPQDPVNAYADPGLFDPDSGDISGEYRFEMSPEERQAGEKAYLDFVRQEATSTEVPPDAHLHPTGDDEEGDDE
jgi:hypothetical protein